MVGKPHYCDVIVSAPESQITGVSIVWWTIQAQIQKNISKLHVAGFCEGNSPLTCEFPAQRASNAENVSIWWRHHELSEVMMRESIDR